MISFRSLVSSSRTFVGAICLLVCSYIAYYITCYNTGLYIIAVITLLNDSRRLLSPPLPLAWETASPPASMGKWEKARGSSLLLNQITM